MDFLQYIVNAENVCFTLNADQDLKITRLQHNTTDEGNVQPLDAKIFTIEPGYYYVLFILMFLVLIVLIVLKTFFHKCENYCYKCDKD